MTEGRAVGAGAVSVKRKVVAMAGVSLRRGMMGALAVATGGGGGRAAPNGGGWGPVLSIGHPEAGNRLRSI